MPNAPASQHSAQKRTTKSHFEYGGLAQHCLVEHALCPLDVRQSLTGNAINEYGYFFQDKNRNKKQTRVRVACPFGLSPNDELYLWGLLQLTLAQDEPATEFVATPHYCLRQLGIVSKDSDQQKRYETFRQAIHRLSGVVYQNDRFYDPIRGEHRDVAFGLIKYSLPLDAASSRAWRFVWDQQFFAFCNLMRGSFQFDLDLYRGLDFASRRLFLLLQKLFWRRDSIKFDVSHVAINVMGLSSSLTVSNRKIKVRRCAEKLLQHGIISLPCGATSLNSMFTKRGKGQYDVSFHRGPYFDQPGQFSRRAAVNESPCYDPLRSIGFDQQAIGRILHRYKLNVVQEWADITLAAVDRKIVKKDPKAFFNYYIVKAAKNETTPPDWWRELRKQEERKRFDEERRAAPTVADFLARDTNFDDAFNKYLEVEAKAAFEKVTTELFQQFQTAGHPSHEARDSANRFAKQHLRNRFLSDHPEFRDAA